jgi:DNA-binding transcriptional LysR family regulator
VTYGIQKLEAQFGIPLFDRTTYRPALTEAGRALLPRARRIAEETNAFRDTSRSLASGLEAELTIVLDTMFPMPAVVKRWWQRRGIPRYRQRKLFGQL